MRLLHYVHCPFCVRVRMVLGFFGQDFKSEVIPYDEEELLVKLTGTKMLPIMEIEGAYFNESLDIISKLDPKSKLNTSTIIERYANELEPILNDLGSDVHSLAMPYWMWTPEFSNKSRKYFQAKKEVKRGPFKNLVHNRSQFINSLNNKLSQYSNLFKKDFSLEKVDLIDILLASHLWGLYIVPEYQFSAEVHSFLQSVGKQTNFEYHKDFWN